MNGKELVLPERWSELDLVRAVRHGNRLALEYLVVRYGPIQGIIKSLARHIDPYDFAGDELTAAGHLGTLEALRHYDPDKGVRFITYAYKFIRGEMIKTRFSQSQRREWNAGRSVPRLVPLSGETDEDAAEHACEAELFARDDSFGLDPSYGEVDRDFSVKAVNAFVAALPPGQRDAVRDVFWGGHSHAETASRRGVSRPAISRTLQRAFERGRQQLVDHKECLAA